jgi:C4-dicarboxylate transporter/malic acid transport protein
MTTTQTPPAAPAGVLHTFHPAWFAAVMGTGALSVATFQNPGGISGLKSVTEVISVGILLLAYALALVLAVPYLWRWVRHPDIASKDLRHPVLGAMFSTFPAGLLVLAVATANAGTLIFSKDIVTLVVAVLAATGGILAFIMSLVFSYILFVMPNINPEQVGGGWFIPPVVNILLPLALVPLLEPAGKEGARVLLMIGYAAWGIGFFLFILVTALLYSRMIYHALPAAHFAPSLWIGLAPIGIGSLDLLRMAQKGTEVWGEQAQVVLSLSSIVATMLWGFGLWWLPMAALLLVRYLRNGGLHFTLGWWAFTFPVGAYTISTMLLGRHWKVDFVEWLGVLFYLLLLAFWLTVAFRTIIGMRTGEVWKR